jgi:hypothetical protein
MDENIRTIVLDGLSSLFKEGNFITQAPLMEKYLKDPEKIIKSTPAELNLTDIQRVNTLKIAETVAFVNLSLKNIPVEKLIIPSLLSCIELSLWEEQPEGQEVIASSFCGYSVYALPIFIDFYFKTSSITSNSTGEVEKIIYSIRKLISSKKYKDSFSKLPGETIRKHAEEEWLIYRQCRISKWKGITSFILSREEEIIRTLKNLMNLLK